MRVVGCAFWLLTCALQYAFARRTPEVRSQIATLWQVVLGCGCACPLGSVRVWSAAALEFTGSATGAVRVVVYDLAFNVLRNVSDLLPLELEFPGSEQVPRTLPPSRLCSPCRCEALAWSFYSARSVLW